MVYGSLSHFIKGIRNNHPTNISRVITSLQAAPRTGVHFVVFYGLANAFNLGMMYGRQKEDNYDKVLPFAAAVGLVNVKRGLRFASTCTLLSGGLAALLLNGDAIIQHFTIEDKDTQLDDH
ncbi:hypothetical protein IFM89_014959 [Coptis chinensis]|uniref:Uncharacterized protein n=1 Tax=Coptis chinensis TaxID=261450 RepID=A0A835H3W8_9MAGN|nr:hypothetical protein IFM89_014959 [Coptis chinensis]